MRMAWPGRDPLADLRAQVDEVDDRLADLLAERAALTARDPAAQGRCPGTPAGTRTARTRSSRGWPATRPASARGRLRRIMHAGDRREPRRGRGGRGGRRSSRHRGGVRAGRRRPTRGARSRCTRTCRRCWTRSSPCAAGDPVGPAARSAVRARGRLGTRPRRGRAGGSRRPGAPDRRDRGLRPAAPWPGVRRRPARSRWWTTSAGPTTGSYASAVLLHLSRAATARPCCGGSGAVVRPGGVLAVSAQGRATAPAGRGTAASAIPGGSPTGGRAPFVTLLEDAGWRLTRLDRRAGRREAGRPPGCTSWRPPSA